MQTAPITALAGRLVLVLLGALLALGVLVAAGLGPGRYTLNRERQEQRGSLRGPDRLVRLDRWTGAIAYTSDLAQTNRLATCQRDAAAWRDRALYWEQVTESARPVNPFRERLRVRRDSAEQRLSGEAP